MRLDDDTYLDTSPASIGEIKFDVFRTTVPKKKGKTQNSTLPGLPHSEKVHERSKKATAHRVKYVASLILFNARSLKFNPDLKQLWRRNF